MNKGGKGKRGRGKQSPLPDPRDGLFQPVIANVRLAVKLLREAAWSHIPDLDAAAPPEDWHDKYPWDNKWSKDDLKYWRAWEQRARARAAEAIDWRDRLTTHIGSVDIHNQCPPDPAFPRERLIEELGYVLAEPDPAQNTPGLPPVDQGWRPPESLLGEFPDRPPRRATERYFAPSPQIYGMNDARALLGPPPRHLTDPPVYSRIDKRIEYGLGPHQWRDYAAVILTQCLLEQTRALELCQWCDARIAAWESALYPVCRLGAHLKHNKRELHVERAGHNQSRPVRWTTEKALLALKQGSHTFNDREELSRFRKDVPELALHLRVEHDQTKARRVIRSLPAELRERIEDIEEQK